MQKFSPAQRKAIYLLLAMHYDIASKQKSPSQCKAYLHEKLNNTFICHLLNDKYESASNFPEFFEFEPSIAEYNRAFDNEKSAGGWFAYYELKGYAERATVLAFAAAMCK